MGTKLSRKRKYYKFNSNYGCLEFRHYKRTTRKERRAAKREKLLLLVSNTLIDEFLKYKDDLYKSKSPLLSGFNELSKKAKNGFGGAWVFDIDGHRAS